MGKVFMILSSVFTLVWCFCVHQSFAATECDQILVGGEGVVYSYNFPLDFQFYLTCRYTHYFKEYMPGEVKEVCLQFRRFDLGQICGSSSLVIEGNKYCGRGVEQMDNLCFPVLGSTFQMTFLSEGLKSSGFYANYVVYTHNEVTTSLPGNETETGYFCIEPFEWLCFSGEKCIRIGQKCDGIPDCEDESDESFAHARCRGQDGERTMYRSCNLFSTQITPSLSDCLMQTFYPQSWVVDWRNRDADYGPSSAHVYVIGKHYLRSNFTENRGGGTLFWRMNDDLKDEGIPYCLTFWYHMKGRDAGELRVSWGSYDIIWTRAGNLGDKWYKAEIERVPTPQDDHFIIFQASRGSEIRAQVSLDDLSLMPGPCHPNDYYKTADDLSCAFEEGLCGWTEDKDWHVTDKAYDDSREGPDGAAQGKYYIEPAVKEGRTMLESPLMTLPASRCMIFSIFIPLLQGAQGDMVIPYAQYQDGSTKQLTTFHISGNSSWQTLQMDINEDQAYKIVLNASRFAHFDDFAFVENSCGALDYGQCGFFEYRCDVISHRSCIPNSKLCDGNGDCENGDDEENCGKCKAGAFHCKNRQCIPESQECDGVKQCRDGSDEINCSSDRSPVNRSHWSVIGLVFVVMAVLVPRRGFL